MATFSLSLSLFVLTSCRILLMPREQLSEEQKLQMSMACAGARALCSLSESKPNKETMRKFGLVPLMSRLLKSVHIDLIVPIMGTCQNCASEVEYCGRERCVTNCSFNTIMFN